MLARRRQGRSLEGASWEAAGRAPPPRLVLAPSGAAGLLGLGPSSSRSPGSPAASPVTQPLTAVGFCAVTT